MTAINSRLQAFEDAIFATMTNTRAKGAFKDREKGWSNPNK